MGHFERGRWVETPSDTFVTTMVNMSSSFAGVAERLLTQLNEWDNSSDVFRNGRHMKYSDLMREWWKNEHLMNSSGIPNHLRSE